MFTSTLALSNMFQGMLIIVSVKPIFQSSIFNTHTILARIMTASQWRNFLIETGRPCSSLSYHTSVSLYQTCSPPGRLGQLPPNSQICFCSPKSNKHHFNSHRHTICIVT